MKNPGRRGSAQSSWLGLEDGEYQPIERSGLVDLGAQGLAEQLDWPPIDS